MADQILIQFRSDLDAFRKELGEVKAQIKGVGDSAKKAGDDSNSAFGSLNSTLKSVGTAIAGAFAVQQVVAFGQEAIKLAKDAEGIERAFGKLNRRGLLDELRGAVQGTVSDVKLMQAAVKANNFKLPLDQLANLFKFAAQRARDTGEQVDYLVESIVLGISRKSIPILDNLGLSATEVQEEFARTGDMATAVGNIISKSMGDSPEGAATAIDQASANIENFKTQLGQLLLVPTGAAAKKFSEFLSSITGPNFEQKRQSQFAREYEESLNKMAKAGASQDAIQKQQQANYSKQLAVIRELEAKYERMGKQDYNTRTQLHLERERFFIIHEINKQRDADIVALQKLQEEQDAIAQKESEKKSAEAAAEAIKKKNEAQKESLDLMITELEMQAEADAQWKKSQDEIDARKKKQTEDWLKWIEDFYAADEEMHTDSEESKTKTTEEEARKREEAERAGIDIFMTYFNMSMQIMERESKRRLDNELDAIEDQRKADLQNKELTEAQRQQINDKYDSIARKKKREEWQREKNRQIIATNINTAAAVMRAYADSGYVGAIAAAATGSAQLILIASQPEPKFHSGEVDIRPEGKRRMKGGEFRATLIEGESVINAKATQKYRDELEAINDLNFDDLLIKKYILPVLEEQQAMAKQSFAENIASSLRMQAFSDGNIVEMLKRVNSTSKENATMIAAAMKSQRRDLRQPS